MNDKSNTDRINIIQLDKSPPYPPSSGAEKRTWRTAEKLSEIGELWLASPWHNGVPVPDMINLIPIQSWVVNRKILSNDLWYSLFAFKSRHLIQRIITNQVISAVAKSNVEFDVVISEAPQLLIPAHKIAESNDAKLIIHKHNSYFDLLDQYLEESPIPNTVKKRAVHNLMKYEIENMSIADLVVFQSEKDRDDFNIPQNVLSVIIPNGTDYQTIQAGGDPKSLANRLDIDVNSQICLFIGSYDYEPNRAAADIIINKIAPQLPTVEFLLVGRHPPRTSQENVYIAGFIENLSDALDLADIAVCPLPRGSGTKLKMMDYLAAGLPVITSTVGADGLPVIDGEHVLIRDKPEDVVSAINMLKHSPELRSYLSQRGHSLAQNYSWSGLMQEYEKSFMAVIQDGNTNDIE